MSLQKLQYQPNSVWVSIFLAVWAAMFMLLGVLQPSLVKWLTGDPTMDSATFFSTALFEHPDAYMGLNFISTTIMFFLPAVIFAYLISSRPIAYFNLNKKTNTRHLLWVIVGVMGIFPLIAGLGALIQELPLGAKADALESKRNAAMNAYLQRGGIMELLKNIFLVALVPAIYEELFFRGIIQRIAYQFTHNVLVSFILTAFIFTLFHASLYQFLPIMIGGIILCWVYYITGDMKLNILLHFLSNGIQVVIQYFSSAESDEGNQMLMIALYLLIGILVSIVVFLQLRKSATPLPQHWTLKPMSH